MDLSIIITYHNEGALFLRECLDQIRATIDVENYEIIVVDDCSAVPLVADGFTLVRHSKNKGVGAAFDSGMKYASSENVIIMACDIRFMDNGWASKTLKEIQAHPKAITCTSCVAISSDIMDPDIRKDKRMNGATIELFGDNISNPKMPANWRTIINGKWLAILADHQVPSYEIPCLMGAFYGVRKAWYEYIDGFNLHYLWGTLEPYISLKSWFFGGSVRVAPAIETAHIFKKNGTHGTPQAAVMYNKLLVSTLLFTYEDSQKLINHLGACPNVMAGKSLLANRSDQLNELRTEYAKKIKIDRHQWIKRFNINWKY